MSGSTVQAVRRSVQNLAVGRARKQALQYGKHIELRNIPVTATVADVRRTVERTKLQGVHDVALLYDHFRPTGTALISLTRQEFLRNNLRMLQGIAMAGIPLEAEPRLLDDADTVPARTRGVKGREEAARRGALNGNGPQAGLPNGDRTVTVWGFPGKTEPAAVEFIVRDFKLARSGNGKASIFKIQVPAEEFSMHSRFVIMLSTVSEAHRLARELNMTFFEPESLGRRFMLRARIIH
ncbi:hypothetical protein AX17_005115 [Amanita inopinata Kibby_2008]|nr:hypothetical protein AX17_005115 [Amanita inopinata Kibby_2008]